MLTKGSSIKNSHFFKSAGSACSAGPRFPGLALPQISLTPDFGFARAEFPRAYARSQKPRAALLVYNQSINQSISKLYLSTVVIKAEKLMGPCQKKKGIYSTTLSFMLSLNKI